MSTPQRKLWTTAEDEILKDLVQELGVKRWTDICRAFLKRMPGSKRTLMQCRERYVNQLQPGVKKGNWTSSEILLIFQLHKKHANQWSRFCSHLPGRSQNAIKCFFYSALRKALARHNKQQAYSKRCMRTIKSLVRDKTTTDFLNMEEEYRDISQPTQDSLYYTPLSEADLASAYETYQWAYWSYYFSLHQQLIFN